MAVYNLGGEGLSSVNTVVEAQRQFSLPVWPWKFSAVPFPGPVKSPVDISVDMLAEHASRLFKTAWKWTFGGSASELKDKYWMCMGAMRKDDWMLSRKLKVAIRELKDDSSDMSLMIYVWWEMQRAKDKGHSGVSPYHTFDTSRITSKQVRGFFWRDCGQVLKVSPGLWTQAAEEAHDLFKDFEAYNAYLEHGDIDTAKHVWDLVYATELKLIYYEHERQYARVREALSKKAYDYDIGLWIATNVGEYLKVKDILAARLV